MKSIPFPLIIKLLSQVAQSEGIDNLGITAAKKSKIANTGTFGYLLSNIFKNFTKKN
jgi:hypothetical protein